MEKTGKKQGNAYRDGVRATDVTAVLYLICIFGVYPWITTNKYFNITITRYRFFIWASITFILLMAFSNLLDRMILKYYGVNGTKLYDNDFFRADKLYKSPMVWIEAFALSNMCSFLFADDMNGAFTGNQGRFMGLGFFLCAIFVLFFLCAKLTEAIFVFFEISTLYAAIVAIYQHMEPVLKSRFWKIFPFAHYKDKVVKKHYNIFISTFGNINIYASFLAIAIPVLLCIVVYSKNCLHRRFATVVLAISSMTIMIANSDSAYLGIAAALLLLVIIAYRDDCLKRFWAGLVWIAFGYLCMTLLNFFVLKEYDRRGGLAEMLDRPVLVAFIFMATILLYLIWSVAEKRFEQKLAAVNKNKVCLIFGIGLTVCVILVVIYGICKKMSLFTFNYKWGTYRGYIWTKCKEIFCDADFSHKLFGHGQESLRALMNERYYDEMIQVTKKVYDNAHNELLQYLITIGITGLVSYLGMFISSFVYIWKRAKKRVIPYVCLVAMTGYFAQALINVGQPITTPFLFVFMALGLGYVRNLRNEGDSDD
ncbi:MAG: O-antigen ligase family protein [Eubacteriales bacterium]|nr:O-antigen ligase family protein [Lachnospiraceae bacterium]MDO5126266.1 O-antigen ligase family protein [Eubacteriales bacterium]